MFVLPLKVVEARNLSMFDLEAESLAKPWPKRDRCMGWREDLCS
jgi:hypothetical protein